jgi:hypothetical protein
MYYDGTNFIINPKLAGSGYVKILGDLMASVLTVTDISSSGAITTGTLSATNVNATNVNIGGIAAVTTDDARLSDARTPLTHASTHITGGSDVIANVVAAGNSGLMTGTDKTKLDGLSNYTLPAATASALGGIKGNGATIACSGTNKMTGIDGTGAIICGADLSGSGVTSSVTVTVGPPAAYGAELTVTDANVSSSSKIFCTMAYEKTGDNFADNILASGVQCTAGQPGTGSFKMAIFAGGAIVGPYKVNYSIQ